MGISFRARLPKMHDHALWPVKWIIQTPLFVVKITYQRFREKFGFVRTQFELGVGRWYSKIRSASSLLISVSVTSCTLEFTRRNGDVYEIIHSNVEAAPLCRNEQVLRSNIRCGSWSNALENSRRLIPRSHYPDPASERSSKNEYFIDVSMEWFSPSLF